MKKLAKEFIVLISVLLYSTTTLFAQTLSTYEQKRYDLAAQTATEIIAEVPELGLALGMSVKRTDFTNKYEEMDFFEGLIESVGAAAVYSGNTDYQSYKVKEIYKNWMEKRRTLDRTMTKADEQRANNRKKKNEQVFPERGTKALLLYSVKKDFEKWAVKDEFEKTDELMERMRVYGPHIFDSICYLYTCGKWSVAFSTEATDYSLKYDADLEVYRMEFIYGSNNNTKTIVGKAPVPISYARDGRTKDIAVSSLRIVNGLIIPREVSVKYYLPELSSEEYLAKFRFDSIPGENPLIVCFSELGYTEKVPIELFSHCMNPGEYFKEREREAFVMDSLEKRERFIRDSIETRRRFVKDSIEKRERFVRDSLLQRERFIQDSIKHAQDSIKRLNNEIRESNNRYSMWLKSYEQQYVTWSYGYPRYVEKTRNVDGTIKKCSIDGNVLTLKCGKKEFSGTFSTDNVKTDMGRIYNQTGGGTSHGDYKYVTANEDGTLVIYQFGNIERKSKFVFLIVKSQNEVYEIKGSTQKKLKEIGLIK